MVPYLLYFTIMQVDLSGIWIGDYGGHGEEDVQINHKGYSLEAIKITGFQ